MGKIYPPLYAQSPLELNPEEGLADNWGSPCHVLWNTRKPHRGRVVKLATAVGPHRYMHPVVRKELPSPHEESQNYFFGGFLGPKYPGCISHVTDPVVTKRNLYAGCFSKKKGKQVEECEPKGKDMSALIKKNRQLWWDVNLEKNIEELR